MCQRQARVQPVFWGWVVRSRGPCRWRLRHITPQLAQTRGADQHEQSRLGLVAHGQVAQPLLDQRCTGQPRSIHDGSIAPGGYFDPATTVNPMVATVRSHAIINVAPASVTSANPMVNCSIDDPLALTAIGARSRSNFGS